VLLLIDSRLLSWSVRLQMLRAKLGVDRLELSYRKWHCCGRDRLSGRTLDGNPAEVRRLQSASAVVPSKTGILSRFL
jgi:hypothetical protein